MADGSIIIDTLLKTDGYMRNMKKLHASQKKLKGQIEETTSKIERLESEINDLNNSEVSNSKMERLKEQIADCDKNAEELKTKMSDLKSAKVPTQEFNELQQFITVTEDKLNRLLARQDKMSELGKKNTHGWKNLQYDIDEVSNSLAHAKSEMEALQSSGGAFTSGVNTAQYQKLNSELSTVNAKKQQYNTLLDATRVKEQQSRDNTIQKKRMEQEKLNRTLAVQNTKYDEIKAKINSVGGAFSRLGSAARQNLGSKVLGATNSCRKGLDKLGKTVSRFTKRLLNVVLSVFVFTVLTRAITALRDRMSLLIKKNQQFSSSLSQIKGNLKTAFQNIFDAALPALNALMSVLAKVTAVIANFTATIFGKSVKASQDAANAADDQAEAIGGVGKAAKKASEYLNHYDEMNVQSSSDSSGGGGGSSSVGTTYEDIDVNSGVNNFINRIKAAWENADFTEIGTIIGNKIKGSLDVINWDSIQSVANKIGKSFATFLNGVFETDGLFTSVGTTIAEAVNTAISGAFSFASNFHWDSCGNAIASSINGFFKNYDAKKAGLTFTEFASGALSTLTTALSEIDWSTVGQKIVDLISSIDWIKLAAQVATALLGLINGAVQLLFGFASGISENLSKLFEELGLDSVAGFFKGISDNLKESATWLKEKFKIVVDAVKDFFGIHSPSTVFAEIGGFLIEGLKKGISDAISGALSWLKTNVVDKVLGAVDGIKEIAVTVKGNIHDTFTKAKESFNAIKNSEAIKTLKQTGKEVIDGIKSTWASIKSEGVVKTLSQVGKNVIDSAKQSWIGIKTETAIKTLKETGKDKIDKAKQTWTSIKSGTKTLTLKATDYATSKVNSFKKLWDKLTNKTLSIKGNIQADIANIKSMINTYIIGKVNSNVIGTINKYLPGKIKIPNIPYLAKGGVIPPNAPFLAMLGDQRNGTNIETPLDTMIQAFTMALDSRGSSSASEVHVYVGGKEITDYVIKDVKDRTDCTGRNPLLV